MRGLTANHRADDDERIVSLGSEQAARSRRELPRPRHPDNVYVFSDQPMPDECIDGTVGKLAGDGFVETGRENRDATSCARGRADELSHSVGEQVTELVALRLEVALIFRCRGRHDGDALLDAESVALEADQLPRIVRHRTNRLESEIEEDLRTNTVIAKVGLESEPFVRLDRVRASVLQLVRLELVQQTNAPSFLIEIHDDTAAALLNHRHRRVQLPPAIAAKRTKDVAGETLRVHANEDSFAALHVAIDERDVLTVVDIVAIADDSPLTVVGRK